MEPGYTGIPTDTPIEGKATLILLQQDLTTSSGKLHFWNYFADDYNEHPTCRICGAIGFQNSIDTFGISFTILSPITTAIWNPFSAGQTCQSPALAVPQGSHLQRFQRWFD